MTIACILVAARAQADTAAAKSFFESGSVAFALGDYSGAANDYERAFAEKPDPALLYNAAQAHRLAGNPRRALLLYRSYQSTPLFTDRPALKQVARRITELENALAGEDAAAHAEPTETTAWSDEPHLAPPPPALPSEPDLSMLAPLFALLPLGMLLGGIWGRRRRPKPTLPSPQKIAPPPPPVQARKTLLLEVS
jgi:tetratricopeptide (TPR) repeat protein